MKKSYFLFVVFGLLYFYANAQNASFITSPHYLEIALGRDDASCFVIGNKAFVGLGLQEGFVLGNDFAAFDAETNQWQSVADFPPTAGRQYATTFSINGDGYLVGGTSGNNIRHNDVWRYDDVQNQWTQQSNFTGSRRQGMQATVYNNDAYMFFGRDTTGFLKEVWKFSGDTESWIQLPDFPSTGRYLSADVKFGNDIYFVGGFDGTHLLQEVWKFNLENETWAQLSDFAGDARWYAKGFVFDSKIYIGTGWNETVFLNDFWVFDPVSQAWNASASIPGLGRKGTVAFNIGSKAFVGLGVKQNGERTKEFFEFVYNASIDKNEILDFQIFPNPTTGYIQIDIPLFSLEKTMNYRIIDVSGKVLKMGNVSTPLFSLDVSEVHNGLYFLHISSANHQMVKTFSIEKF